tara:strand:- start:1061 stop:1348 length:288 start_codon:yes stop_codon:yes gene_type:complete
MAKYIQITTGAGNEMIPIGEGLFVERTSATAMRIYSTASFSHHYALVTVGSTFAMVTAINAAIETACQTSWTNAVVPVALPNGETVTSIAVTVFS